MVHHVDMDVFTYVSVLLLVLGLGFLVTSICIYCLLRSEDEKGQDGDTSVTDQELPQRTATRDVDDGNTESKAVTAHEHEGMKVEDDDMGNRNDENAPGGCSTVPIKVDGREVTKVCNAV